MRKYENIDWNDPNIYLLFIGLSMLMIPLYRRDLLINKKSFQVILIISTIALIAALVINQIGLDKKYWGLISLHFPIYIVLSYRFLRFLFVLIKKREPIDTAFDFKGTTPWIDRIFNIVYFIQALIIPSLFIILIHYNIRP